MRLAAVAASNRRTTVFRVTDSGRLVHRWIDEGQSRWAEWSPAPLEVQAQGVAAISGWPEQIEVFALDVDGGVWNRWWWADRSWTPAGFNWLGRPFPEERAIAVSALSAGDGHFNVFVESQSGEMAVLPHLPGEGGATWRRCEHPSALGDGWWPAWDPDSVGAFRV